MSTFYAQPYCMDAHGFFFETPEEYRAGVAQATNRYGWPIEEFEIQFIDGAPIDAALARALELHQSDIVRFMECEAEWTEHQKRAVIIAVRECAHLFSLETGDPDDLDLDIYELESLRELAEEFLDDGLFGDNSEQLANYIDLDAIARDLGFDYSETSVAGTNLVYRCG